VYGSLILLAASTIIVGFYGTGDCACGHNCSFSRIRGYSPRWQFWTHIARRRFPREASWGSRKNNFTFAASLQALDQRT
jgi:hypothetical protein